MPYKVLTLVCLVTCVSLAAACGVSDGSPVPLVGSSSGSGSSSSGSGASGTASGAGTSGSGMSGAGTSGAASSGTGAMVSFATDVMPIFQTSCAKPGACHNDPTTAVKGGGGAGGRPYLGLGVDAGAPTMTDIMKVYMGLTTDGTSPNHSTSWELLKPMPMKYIAPGDPAHSYLMIKMDGSQLQPMYDCSTGDYGSCGLPMPSDSPTGPLDQATRDKVRNWISQGANAN
jgi:hypothetical protein